MPFELMPLPYAKDALEPVMSARTLEFHHGKHHAGYVKTLNELIEGTPFASQDLESIIRATAKATDAKQRKIFNNAAQVWNHNFFWDSVAPNGGGRPPEQVEKRLNETFQSYENFRDRFVQVAVDQFGTGWAWLVVKDGRLDVISTEDAEVPFMRGQHPLCTIDVWEHAYYLDYQNERPRFVKAVIETHLNWQLVSKRLAEAGQRAA
ncbi:MAG: superoxide dismutase [Steroidobacteraceae bacterium]